MPSTAGYLDVATSDAAFLDEAPPQARRRRTAAWARPAAVAAVSLASATAAACAYAAAARRGGTAGRAALSAPGRAVQMDEVFASTPTMLATPAPTGVSSAAAPAAAAATPNLKPLELMHDGNPCDVNEEFFGGLCYKTCALLTNWEAPIRTTPWTCCESHPCTPMNEQGKIGFKIMCTGFDVGGDGGCPHEPGACLTDEEMHDGRCYKKCALLTRGTFPNRIGPDTCCDGHGLACLNPHHSRTNQTFDVGGGKGDHDPSTPSEAHFPDLSLTEDKDSDQPQSAELEAAVAAEKKKRDEQVAPLRVALKPLEIMDDGNVCADNEEFYGGLCYKRCSLLTDGQASIRTSSWTCCEQHPCFPWKQLGSIGTKLLCNGYDVSGDGGCPHKPGACLLDEELHMGVCYKKCSLLTGGAFPHRTAPATCCKTTGIGCLNFGNDETSDEFDVGGGAGDRDPDTPAKPHPPLETLTEKAAVKGELEEQNILVPRRLRAGAAA